jgi:hypothetical protein
MFSRHFDDALLVTAMIDEMARADNWQGLDECLAIKPDVIKTFTKYAEAALRALKHLEENKSQVVPFLIN